MISIGPAILHNRHNMVNQGVHTEPSLRNRVVIFFVSVLLYSFTFIEVDVYFRQMLHHQNSHHSQYLNCCNFHCDEILDIKHMV